MNNSIQQLIFPNLISGHSCGNSLECYRTQGEAGKIFNPGMRLMAQLFVVCHGPMDVEGLSVFVYWWFVGMKDGMLGPKPFRLHSLLTASNVIWAM